MGKTIEELDEVIGYYLVTRELCDLIQAGPHTGSIESLNIYLEVCDWSSYSIHKLLNANLGYCVYLVYLLCFIVIKISFAFRKEAYDHMTELSDLVNIALICLQALDKLAEAQNYFNKNNPQSVELENIVSTNILYKFL